MRRLSKSKLIAFRQCPKRLWLELHKPELRDDSGSQAAFNIGYQGPKKGHVVMFAIERKIHSSTQDNHSGISARGALVARKQP